MEAPEQISESLRPNALEAFVVVRDGDGGEKSAGVMVVGDGLDGEGRRAVGGGAVVEKEFGDDEGHGGAFVVEAFGEL